MKNNFKLIAVYVFAICLNILYNYMEPVFFFNLLCYFLISECIQI